MNLQQAQLLVKGANHVRTVGPMRSVGMRWKMRERPVCFVCEMYRAGIIQESECRPWASEKVPDAFNNVFGITEKEAYPIVGGDYENGPQCYEVVKKLLTKYGYAHLLEPEEVIPIHVPQEAYPGQFTKAEKDFDWRNPRAVAHA